MWTHVLHLTERGVRYGSGLGTTRGATASKMVSYDEGANTSGAPGGGWLGGMFSTEHKTIGRRYLWLSLASVLVGMVLSALLRVHSSWPAAAIPFLAGFESTPDRYSSIRLLHGSLMVFFVLTAAPQMGFGNLLLPLQIGAEETAFPRLNLISLWLTMASLVGMVAAFFLPASQGIDVWLVSAAAFSIGALLSALNFSVTVIELRTKGMTLPRMPVTVWAWFINAILSLLIFSVLLAGSTAVLSDRLLGSNFFSSSTFLALQPQNLVRQGSLPVLWERLFWYFAQAEVYVAMLPCFGIVTHLIATFARKPVWKERVVVLERGDQIRLEPIELQVAAEALSRLEPGFDLLAWESAAAIAAVTAPGAWRLTLTRDPVAAIDVLVERFSPAAVSA